MTVSWSSVDAARADWEALGRRSPLRSPFASATLTEALAEATGWTARAALVRDDEAVCAGLLALERRLGPLRALALPPIAPYSALLLDAPLHPADVHADRTALGVLLDDLAQRYDQVTLALHPALGDLRPLLWRGWRVAPAYTGTLSLTGDPTAGWSTSARRTFRKHADAFELREGSAVIGEVLPLVEASHARHDQPLPLPLPTLRRLAERLDAAGEACPFVVTRDGRPEAGVVLLCDGETATYWLAGSLKGPAMTVLLGLVMRRLQADGYTTFDFVGANTPSIAEFKRTLGAVLTPHARARLVPNPALRVLNRLRGTL